MPLESIQIGVSINKLIKIGKSDLIDIDCIDQSVKIDDTLVSSLSIYVNFYRFHRFISEDISVNRKMKTDFMPTVNLLTIELQSNDQTIITEKSEKSIFSSKPGLNLPLVCRRPVFHHLDQPPYQNNVGIVPGVANR